MPNPADHRDSSPNGSGSRLASFSIRFPVTICMLFLSMVTIGGIAITKIPLVMLPDISFPELFVNVPYPNATPEQIQETILKPIEESLSTIPGITRMTSRAGTDSARINVAFDWSSDTDIKRAEVREKVDQIRNELPDDVDRIQIMNFSSDDVPILGGRISSGRDLGSAYDFLDLKVKKAIERIPGVGEVELWGVQRRQIDVGLRIDDLKRYRVDISELFRNLDAVNLTRSLGYVDDGGTRYGTVTDGLIASLDDLRRFPVNARGLTLNDIADVEFGQPTATFGQHLNGNYAIGFSVRKTSQANTVDTVQRVLDGIALMNDDPSMQGVEVLVWHDAAKEITNSLSGLLQAGSLGAVLAVAVLFLFLRRLDASLVIGLAIPFSVISAVGFLYFQGSTLNVLTMMGLMLSTGMLVDNAVVVLESIFQKLEKGVDRMEAARVGTQEVITAVIAATLTSIIIFVPLIFGQKTNFSIFLGYTGTSIIFALLASLFISLTLIPVAMARFLRIDPTERSPWQQASIDRLQPALLWLGRRMPAPRPDAPPLSPHSLRSGWREGGVTGVYLRMVEWPLRHRFLVGFLLVPAVIGFSFWVLMYQVPTNSPDAQELSGLRIQYEFSENYHYAKIEKEYVNPVEKFLFENKARFKILDVMSQYRNDSARSEVYFDKENVTLDEMEGIRTQIREGLPVIPGAEITLGRQEGAQDGRWMSVSLYGDSTTELRRIETEAKRRMRADPQFLEVDSSLDSAREEVQIRLRRDLARKYNVSPQAVSGVLAIAVRGREVRGYRTPEGEVEIMVQIRPEDLQGIDDLKSIIVGAGSDGQQISLSQVADLTIGKIPGEIEREDRQTYTQLWMNYGGDKQEDGQAKITKIMNDIAYPPGYGWSFGFWTRREQQQDQEFLFNLLLALFMVYFVMASLFESLTHPFAIMLSLPFSVVGIAGFLWATNAPFNMMAMIGVIVLVGVVVNNGIVLIDHINNLRKRGLPRRQAIMEGCRERLRPICMTATTTIVGLMPLGFGDSGFFEMKYFPMARTVMGGLMASTILTLIVLPTYYSLLDDLAIWVKRTWQMTGVRREVDSPAAGD